MAKSKEKTVITPHVSKKAKILIAEDDPFLRKALGNFMEDEELEIDFAQDGREAIKLINNNQYRLILLDINMPFKTGFDVLKELKNKKKVPPVLVFSNFDQKESKEEALSLGAREYFVKHEVDIDELRMTVRVYLRGEIH